MDQEALERARSRLAEAGKGRTDAVSLEVALDRAAEGLEALAQAAAELEAGIPEQLGGAIQDGMRAEVLPVARHIAEVRGLTAQVIRRLERLQGDVASERRARVEDLALVVDLVSSGWRGVERRLDRLERVLDRVERALEDRPAAPVYRLDDRQERKQPGA